MSNTSLPSSYRRLPAEWEPQDAVWLAWPHNGDDWPGALDRVVGAYARMIRLLAGPGGGGGVRLVVRDETAQGRAVSVLSRLGTDLANVDVLIAPTDRSWTRDTLPFFVHAGGGASRGAGAACGVGGLRAVSFAFNGWARYPDHRLDAQLGATVARDLGLPLDTVLFNDRPVVLEGGAVDGNGQGDLLVTEECLLDPRDQCRNPFMSARDYEAVFARYLGVANVVWLGRGIQGDDTHGHVDDFCRFVDPCTVVLCQEDNAADPNHAVLEENRERLESVRLADGSRPDIVRLPMPTPRFLDDLRLPASYANFLIANRKVLVPIFDDPCDAEALGVLGEVLPGREIVGVDASDLILGLGAIHCLTHEQPRGDEEGT